MLKTRMNKGKTRISAGFSLSKDYKKDIFAFSAGDSERSRS